MSSVENDSHPSLSPVPSVSDDATATHTHEIPIKSVRFSSAESTVTVKHQETSRVGGKGKDIEAKTAEKATNSDSRSDNVLKKSREANNTTRSITEPAKNNNVKGTCAKFLRENPRFLNEPVCQVLPNESSGSVSDCLSWSSPMDSVSIVATTIHDRNERPVRQSRNHSNKLYNSTCQSAYLPPVNDLRPQPLQKHHPSPKIDGIAPLINARPVVVKERISYAHQYNSRTDPNEPTRGKLHGSFVWEPQNRDSTQQRTVQPKTD